MSFIKYKENLTVSPIFLKVSIHDQGVELVEQSSIPLYKNHAKIYRVTEMVEQEVTVKISDK